MDLFAGCGGLSLGVAQAAHALDLGVDVRLALDFEEAATSVYTSNFPDANVVTGSVEELFDGGLGQPFTVVERAQKANIGPVDVLLGGPPCQGHSDLNNRTRRNDPKNELYARMARAAAVLKPTVVIIETVPSVRYDTARRVILALDSEERIGYPLWWDTKHEVSGSNRDNEPKLCADSACHHLPDHIDE